MKKNQEGERKTPEPRRTLEEFQGDIDAFLASAPGELKATFASVIDGLMRESPTKVQEFLTRQDEIIKKGGLLRLQEAMGAVVKIDRSIEEHYKKSGLSVVQFNPKSSGVQTGASIVLSNGEKYYIKTYEGHKSERLDPREFFVYKVLELTGFGSKVEFIPALGSRSVDGFYIATLDAGYTAKEEKKPRKEFKTMSKHSAAIKQVMGGAITPEMEVQLLDQRIAEFLKDEKTATECVALEMLDKCFGLTDTFTNSGNYGFVEVKMDDGKSRAKPKLIDLRISEYYDKDERKFTSKIASEKLDDAKARAICLIAQGKAAFYNKVDKTTNEEVTKNKMSLRSAVEEAYIFTQSNVVSGSISKKVLSENAGSDLELYKNTILKNLDLLEKSLSTLRQ